MYIGLEGKNAVVTGGANGIGRAIALELAKSGANVAVNYHHDTEAANNVVEEIEKIGCKAIAIKADVADYTAVDEMMQMIKKEFGRIDILINNAGIKKDMLLMQMKKEDWTDVITTNLTGVFNCTRAVVIGMMRQKSGKIVNISSVSGLAGAPGQVNYSASKGGINAFTKALSRELASLGVNVNAVSPGFIETRMTNTFSEKVNLAAINTIPMKRFGKPEEIAAAVLFLVSKEACYITGQIITVDGGLYT